MAVPITIPLPPVTSEATSWPSSIPMFTDVQVGTREDADIDVLIGDDWFGVKRDEDGRLASRMLDAVGSTIECPWSAEDTFLVIQRLDAFMADLRAFSRNAQDITDKAATSYALGLAIDMPIEAGGGRLRSELPDIADVAPWPTVLPHPDRLSYQEEGEAVRFHASYRTIIVQGEIVTEKGALVALEPEERAVIVAWAKAFLAARGAVNTLLVHHIETFAVERVAAWQVEAESGSGVPSL